MRKKLELGPPDVYLLGITLALVTIGVWLVFDASYARMADAKWANNDIWYMVKRQLAYAGVGLVGVFFISKMRLTTLLKVTIPLLVISLCLLAAVLVLGRETNGAHRWFACGPVKFQPSELAKLAMVLYLAGVLAQRKAKIRRLSSAWTAPACVVAMIAGLVVIEPDLGTMLAIVFTCCAMLFAAGAMKRHLVGLGVIAGAVGWLAVLIEPYRMDRILVWLNPWRDYYGDSYQIVHSLIALGTGGIAGVGLCEGREKMYIPAASTDFIFSTLGEEAGLIGCVALLALLVLFTYKGLDIARRSKGSYANLLGVGVTSMISIQALINVGTASNSIPATGVPLPFISYGGSSLIFTLAGVGILLAVSRQTNVDVEAQELDENSLDGWRDGRAHLSGHQRRPSSARTRPRRRTAVRR